MRIIPDGTKVCGAFHANGYVTGWIKKTDTIEITDANWRPEDWQATARQPNMHLISGDGGKAFEAGAKAMLNALMKVKL